tara:strand:+ start:2163 stop:2351 length:189 start_codon:yes stop_codon:yes gene_type:complete
MNKILFLFFFIIIGCIPINKKEGNINNNLLDIEKTYSFEEYVNDLKLINKNKTYRDINDIPN